MKILPQNSKCCCHQSCRVLLQHFWIELTSWASIALPCPSQVPRPAEFHASIEFVGGVLADHCYQSWQAQDRRTLWNLTHTSAQPPSLCYSGAERLLGLLSTHSWLKLLNSFNHSPSQLDCKSLCVQCSFTKALWICPSKELLLLHLGSSTAAVGRGSTLFTRLRPGSDY